MSRDWRQFLELLGAGLLQRPVDEGLFAGGVDWNSVLTIAMEQTVLGVVSDAIAAMPGHLQPPVTVMTRLRQFMVVNANAHARLNEAISRLSASFREQQVPVVLLKGQGLAANYPNPTARQVGDIDLYIPREYQGRIETLSRQWADKGEFKTSRNHTSFPYAGIKVELHHTAAYFYTSVNAAYQAWTAEMLERGAFRSMAFNGEAVKLPPLEYDAVYVLHHLWVHFISSGVGFRQICDWSLFMRRYSSQLDLDALRRNLDDFDFHPVWNLFSTFAVRHLGMAWTDFPLAEPVSERKTDRLLRLVFHDGNFDRRGARPKNYLLAKVKMGLLSTKYIFIILPFHPREVLCYYGSFLVLGIQHLFLDWRAK